MEVAVVGRSDFVIGFRLAGIRKTFVAESDEKLVEYITRMLDDQTVGILVLSNQDMNGIPRRLQATLENSVSLAPLGQPPVGVVQSVWLDHVASACAGLRFVDSIAVSVVPLT